VRGAPDVFELTRFVDVGGVPLELHGTSRRLVVRQIVEVVKGHCQTESYAYRLQADEALPSWLIRWEYHRERPKADYPYPLAHVHVNASWHGDEPLGGLHIPTRRVPLELVIWHLITEWEVHPKGDDWRGILEDSLAGFEERRTRP
jgi:hypothetical protein